MMKRTDIPEWLRRLERWLHPSRGDRFNVLVHSDELAAYESLPADAVRKHLPHVGGAAGFLADDDQPHDGCTVLVRLGR